MTADTGEPHDLPNELRGKVTGKIVGSPHSARAAQTVSELPLVSVAETLAGGLGIVDLCYWHYEDIAVALRAAHAVLMTAKERDRYRRFRFERDLRLFLATRVLVRTVLSRYASVASADWRFAAGVHGKPYVAHPRLTPSLHFNLANTSGLVACVGSVELYLGGPGLARGYLNVPKGFPG